jgi:hypothetical protein
MSALVGAGAAREQVRKRSVDELGVRSVGHRYPLG